MFKSRSQGLTIVHADALSFVSYAGNDLQVDHTVSLDAFLADDFEPASIPAKARNRQNRLLLVPDYWVGQTNLSLPSKKRPIVEPFIERNLIAEHPDLPDIGLFHSYAFTASQSEEGNIFVFFLQEPASYALYQKLDAMGIAPFDITIPAFIWGKKLEKKHPKTAEAGVGLVQPLPNASYLYFYHREQFLFSRSIRSMGTPEEDPEILNALTYEINQSVYLFSQKKKADLENIFIDSPNEKDADELAESLGRTVQVFDVGASSQEVAPETVDTLGPSSIFAANDLAPSRKFLVIAHKDHAKAREWRPVQIAGVIIGLLLFVILGAEHYFLLKWASRESDLGYSTVMKGKSRQEVIQQYNQSLDLILAEIRQRSASKTLIDLARALPEDVRIKEMNLRVEQNPGIELTCVIRAESMADFRALLSTLLANMADTFVGSQRLETRDIKLGEVKPGRNYTDYSVQFEFRL